MDGIPGGTGVPFDWLGDGLPMILLLLLALWIVHRVRNRRRPDAVASINRRRWQGFAIRRRRGRSPA